MIVAPRTIILRDAHGRILGLHFDASHRPEHREGIEPLKALLGVKPPPEGGPPSRHRITQLPEGVLGRIEFMYGGLGSVRHRSLHALLSIDAAGRPDRFRHHDQVLGYIQCHDLGRMRPARRGEQTGMTAAWDETSFAVLARDEAVGVVRDIAEALQQQDLAIGWGDAFTGTPGLTLVIISRATPQLRAAFRQVPADTRPEGVPTMHAPHRASSPEM